MWASCEARPLSSVPPRRPTDRKLNGVGSESPGCTSNFSHSIVLPSSRGGVPVFNRHSRQPKPLQSLTKQHRSRLPATPRRILLLPTMNQPIQKSPCSNNRRPRQHHPPIPQLQTKYPLRSREKLVILSGAKNPRILFGAPIIFRIGHLLHHQIHHLSLFNKHIPLPLQNLPQLHPIDRLVTQCGDQAAGPRLVLMTKLNHQASATSPITHPEQPPPAPVPLSHPSNRRITTHLRNQIQIQRKDRRPQPHPRRRHSRLAPGMTRAHHHHIVLLRKTHTSILNTLGSPSFGAARHEAIHLR